MNKFKAVLLLMILQTINSNCSDGCLKCDVANRCQVCDITSFYVVQNGVCVEKAPENCAMITPQGDCFKCKSSYYYDPVTKKCVQISSKQKIAQCQFYKSSKECLICERGFYLEEGVCQPVEIFVPGCLIHRKNTCIECNKGMILHPSRERCVTSPNTDNCLVYGYLDCLECKQGFVLNSNYRVKNLLDQAKNGQINEFLKSVTEGRVDYRLKSNCEPVSVQDCEIFETFSKCKKCRPFHYLTQEKKCKAYPLPSIPNCQIYGNYNLCLSCLQGFKLNSPSECIEVKKISNCKTYNNQTSANICTECQDKYYLFSNNCRERLNIVNKCEKQKLDKDECEQCQTGYVITDDSLKCVTEIQNCLKYSQSNTQTTQHTCTQCKNTYYINDNTCVVGGIANCKVYGNKDTCAQCQNGHYLNDQQLPHVCVQQSEIPQCDLYSTTQMNKCVQCKNDAVLVSQQQACAKITADISNCLVYSDTKTCQQCKQNYQLLQNTCQVIPETEFCYQKQGNNCTSCHEGYYLNSGKCYKPFQFQVGKCGKWTQTDGLETFKCNQCNQYNLPWVLSQNVSICATRVEINSKTNFQSAIQNCLIHGTENNEQICLRCDKQYFISEDKKSCVLSCPNLTLIDVQINENQRANKCIQDNTLADCLKAVTYKNKKICIQCKSGYMKTADNNSNKELISIDPLDMSVRLGVYHLGFSCLQKQNSDVYESTQNQNPSQNCETFSKGQNNKFYCTKCKFGFTGNYQSTQDPNLVNLKCDQKIKDCDVNTYYGGLLNNELTVKNLVQEKYNLLNCHKCLTKGKIPFLFTDNLLGIKQFSLEFGDEKPEDKNLYNSNWMQCMRPNHQSFKMTKERFSSNFPKNCGFGQFIVNKDKDFRLFSDEFNSLRCLFCKPGFRPIYQTLPNNNFKIVDCVEIKNCEDKKMYTTKWFSACAQCKPNHAWVYEQNSEVVNYDQCQKTLDQNCLVVSNDNIKDKIPTHRSQNCLLCKPGFGLNYDGLCEKLNHELCQNNEFQMDYQYFFNNAKIKNQQNLSQLFGSLQYGCSRCKEGYEGFVWNTVVQTCLNSPVLLKSEFKVETNYIPKCQHYTLDNNNKMICETCLSDFIPLQNQLKCIRKSSQPNCKIVDNQMKICSECQKGFVLVEGFCEKPQIKYCSSYATGQKKQICNSCEEKFALHNNHCYPGKVKHCQQYGNQGRCVKCYDGYQYLKLKDLEYCVPVPETLNCKSYLQINDDKRELKCTTCNQGYVLTVETKSQIDSICLPLIPIENCIEYDNQLLLSQSTLKCFKCKEQFFLRNNQCIERKVQILNCKTYSLYNDYCTECQEGNYITNMKECLKYPTGIYGCVEYDSETVCTSCQKNMYLSSNTCVKVPKQNRIKNCDLYSSIDKCSRCQFNFILEDNQCVPAIAQNCLTYFDINECETCPKGFGLKQNEVKRTIDCVHISTQNCLISKNFYPFDCIRCTKLFYEDKGRCFANDQFIPNCDEYQSRNTCKKCEDNYVLSFDNKRCLSSEEFGLEPSDSCSNNVQSQRPFCYACEFGFKFYKNQCIQCREQTLDKGCLYCEGFEKEICLICKPGYFQDTKGQCHRNGTVLINEPETEPVTDTTTTDEQQQVLSELNQTNEEQRQATTVILN